MPITGTCRLCRCEKELAESHFISRKLYYVGKKRLEFSTIKETGFDPAEMKAHLLCVNCEQRLSREGENEVLRHIAPKSLRRFPLSERMRVAYARETDSSISRFAAVDFDVDTDKFAYFALSIIWRRTIHEWVLGNTPLRPWPLDESVVEGMRKYLLGKAPFPPNTSVIVIVCSDEASRGMWTLPEYFPDALCMNFRFHVRGIVFRVVMGSLMPNILREGSCLSSLKPMFYGDCGAKTAQTWDYPARMRAQNK